MYQPTDFRPLSCAICGFPVEPADAWVWVDVPTAATFLEYRGDAERAATAAGLTECTELTPPQALGQRVEPESRKPAQGVPDQVVQHRPSRWSVGHHACGPDGHGVHDTRLPIGYRDLIAWTAELLSLSWVPGTDLDALLTEAAQHTGRFAAPELTAFGVLAHHLRQLMRALEAGKGDGDGRPVPGSPAATENEDDSLSGEWGASPSVDANNLARLLCISASDHLLTLADAMDSVTSGVFSAYTLGRGVLEAAGRCWYLTEPEIDVRERVRRYMNEKLWSINESRRFLDSLKADLTDMDEVKRAILAASESHGFLVQHSSHSGPALDSVWPSAMKVSDLVLPSQSDGPALGSASYQFLSASSHGAEAGLLGHVDQEGDEVVSVVKKSGDHARYLLWPLRAYVAMGDRFLHHYGWDTTAWNQARDAALEVWTLHAAGQLQA